MARYPHGNLTYRKTVTLRGLMASLMACMALVTGVAWATPSPTAGTAFELRTETRCRHMAEAAESLTLVEEFSPATSLGEGEYELSVALHLRGDDGRDLGILKVDDKEVAVTEVVTPDAVGGMSVLIALDATGLEGQTLVAFATLTKDGSVIARSEDIGDERQTVHLPRVTATLAAQDGSSEAMGEAQTTLDARVSWSNVRPDAGLRAVVALVDADTGEPLHDANDREVTSLPMIPQDDEGRMAESGTVDIPITFDGRAHLGRRVTAIARLVHDGKAIASGAEPDAVGTVSLPRVTSTLTESESGLQLAEATSETSITETVSYEALTPGTIYVVTGRLVDAKTGNSLTDANGNALEATAATRELTPMEASGTVLLSYTIDTLSMAGATVTARTTLTRKSDGTVIATTEEATMRLPKMTAEVMGMRSGLSCELADEDAGAIAAISYENLEPGVQCVAWAEARLTGTDAYGNATDEGTLHNADGSDATVSLMFIPESEDGSIELMLPFDGSSLEGRRVAAAAGISCDGTDVATCGNVAEPSQTLCIPKVSTRDLTSMADIDEIPADTTARVKAVVSYDALPAGTYTATLAFVDPETGEDLTGRHADSTFETDGSDGSIALEWPVDTTGLAGRTLSAVTYLKAGDAVVATDYGSEALRVPAMAADLHDAIVGTQIAFAQREAKLEGTVTVNDVTPGVVHEVHGTLVNAESGKELTDGDGKPITGSVTISPDATQGSAAISFSLDARKLAGKDVCARYELVREGVVVATADAVSSESDTMHFPLLTLEAMSEASGDHELPSDGKQKAIAKLSYSNVLPNLTYHLTATLIDAETGDPIKAGDKPIEAETDVTPESAGGTTELTLDCGDTSGLAGKHLTIMATMELDGRTVAAADDHTAREQALDAPSITTNLHTRDGSHEIAAGKDGRLIDTVTYVNLTPGVEYVIEGELVDASTGKPAIRSIQAESQASSTQSKPNSQTNSAEVSKDAFEDKEDDTTVWVSGDSIYHLDETCASAQKTLRRTTLGIAKAADKSPCETESGKTTKVTETSKAETTTTSAGSAEAQSTAMEEEVPVTVKATFTPTEANGTVEVEFSFDATGLEGKKLVALETVRRDKHTVATHRDIGDAEQTITVTDGTDSQESSAESMGQTGVGGGLILSIIAGITLAVIGFALLARHSSSGESDNSSCRRNDDGATDGHR